MRYRSVISVLGFILLAVGILLAAVLPVSFIYGGKDFSAIGIPSLLMITLGGLVWFANRGHSKDLGIREGFAVVSLGWALVSLFGCLPFILSGTIPSFTDAYFETISGFTTTGATILGDIESMSHGLLMWRSLTQWIGGLGIILLSVAILPLLGVGGMQLFQAEVPGVTVEKLSPRISQTARILWLVYVLLTVAETILLMVGGMSLFDAVNHSFTTVSTGGFSTKNASIAHFQSAYIETVIIVFMFLAGASFALHYAALRGNYKKYMRDNEFIFYSIIVVIASVLVFLGIPTSSSNGWISSCRDAIFQTVSIVTTTGFITEDYGLWVPAAQLILLLLMFCGACTGSTAGGIKVVRILILLKNSFNQLKILIHPRAVLPVRHNGKRVDQEIVTDVLTFFMVFLTIFAVCTIIMSALGMDLESAIGSVAASLGNIGPGLGSVGAVEHYGSVPIVGKWVLIFCMITGRLELFTVLLLFTPAFWRR